MKKLLIVISLFFSLSSQAQFNLVLNDSSIIGFENIKAFPSYVKIRTLSSDKRIEIKTNDILGYYEIATNRMFYKRYLPDYKSKKVKYEFIERVVEGELNVYKRIYTKSGGGGTIYHGASYGGLDYTNLPTSTQYLYAEKEGKLKQITATKYSNKTLKGLVLDNDSLYQIVKSKKFKETPKNIENIIRAYNLSKYVPITNEGGLASVVFYRRNKRQLKEKAKLFINDKEYQIDRKGFLNIMLPTGVYSKVCLDNLNDKNCAIVSGSDLFTNHYEVSLNKNREVEIEWREKDDAEWYYNEVN